MLPESIQNDELTFRSPVGAQDNAELTELSVVGLNLILAD